ncbi:MAG TPA: AMP-binding protein [Nocardioides sp.]|nr:AMP-binding protein [Nocardioides sp.]
MTPPPLAPPDVRPAEPDGSLVGSPAPDIGFVSGLGEHGGRVALVDGDRLVTYDDLAARVADAARELAALGRGRQLVSLQPAPTTEFVVAYLAALAGRHAVLLSHDAGLPAAYGASVRREGGRFLATGLVAPDLHPDLRLLLSTSGSTGSPKLVRLSASNLESNARAIATYLRLTADDRALVTLPLDYCYGLSVLHSHLAVGAGLVLTDLSVTEPALWRLARAAGVTSFAGVPYTFDLLEAAGWPHLPTLRLVTQAGGRMSPELVRALAERGDREGWELFVMYGQTEATARIAFLPPHLAATRPSAIGVAIPGGHLRLDPVDGAEPGVGELVYSGPNVMMGYAHDRADLAAGSALTELRTGDLARHCDDGLFEIAGRSSRFAKLFGQRIDLDRVETLLAVEGYDAACAESADDPHQLVVAVTDADPAGVTAARGAAARVAGLPGHAVRAVAVGDRPRLPNGKTDHAAVGRLRVVTGEELPGDPVGRVAAQYRAVLGRDPVRPDDTFTGLGGDSLSYVELSLRLEARLRRLPADWPTRTVADLARFYVGSAAPRSRWARLDTTILLRAACILLIVGSHSNLFLVAGGAHVLLAVAGANFARFLLARTNPTERRRVVLRAAARVAVPASLWLAGVALLTGALGWRNVLLLNDLLGGRGWREPEWHYWFLEVFVYLVVGLGLLVSVPAVLARERRAPYLFPLALLAIALAPRFWATASGYGGDVIHSSQFVAWLFLGGWAAARARSTGQRLVVSALLVAGCVGLFEQPARTAVVLAGVLALVWVPAVPWPRVAIGVTGVLASSSLYVYLTHWQVYPHLEDRWPLGGLLASLAVGVATWLAVERVTGRARRVRVRQTPVPLRSDQKEAA